jgi:phosphoglycolate phosphatase
MGPGLRIAGTTHIEVILMIPIDAILFDLDGTLIDSKRDIALSVQFTQREMGVPESSEDEVGAFIGAGVGRLMARALKTDDPARIERAGEIFIERYRHHSLDNTAPYPHVIETLNHYKGKRLAVVTNKPVKISNRILHGLGLLEYFPVVLGGDSLTVKKPNPEPLWHALRLLKAPAKRALMVGDSDNDVSAGRAAGTHTCGILSNIGDHHFLKESRPDLLILSMNELARHFR